MTKQEKIAEQRKAWREANKEKLAEQQKQWRKANKEKIAEQRKAWCEANKVKLIELQKNYREANKEKITKKAKEYREVNKSKISSINKIYSSKEENKIKRNQRLKEQRSLVKLNKLPKVKKSKTPEERAAYNKTYYQANKEKFKGDKDKRNARNRERKQTEPLFRIKTNIRQLIRSSIKNKGFKKSLKSEKILGCSFDEFKLHLESQWESWMNWDNYGNPKDGLFEPNKTWDIDHIIPVTTAITEEDVVKLNHYTNLKPLCSYVNRWVKRDII